MEPSYFLMDAANPADVVFRQRLRICRALLREWNDESGRAIASEVFPFFGPTQILKARKISAAPSALYRSARKWRPTMSMLSCVLSFIVMGASGSGSRHRLRPRSLSEMGMQGTIWVLIVTDRALRTGMPRRVDVVGSATALPLRAGASTWFFRNPHSIWSGSGSGARGIPAGSQSRRTDLAAGL